MERHDRVSDGSQSDPSPEWTAPGGETGLEDGESYPERPDEADCIYYLRTGFCGYGSRCRFNHPPDRGPVAGAVKHGAEEYPERVGQPVCQYFMKTGGCKFGASCKYNHPRPGGGSVNAVSMNYLGYPLRPGEKECCYYVKTGRCKFGATCKFHHPMSVGLQGSASPSAAEVIVYPPGVESSHVPFSQPYGVVMARPPMLPGSYVQGPYGPILLSPTMLPFPNWSPYPLPVNSPSTQPGAGSNIIYGMAPLSPSAHAYQSMSPYASPHSSIQKEHLYPDRPGQPECQHYLKTGNCKFGSSCRYHHPHEMVAPKKNILLSPLGLPLRPGAPPCSHYAQRGVCKFGAACKFDHPMGTLHYSPSASSLTDMPVAPYPPLGSSFSPSSDFVSGPAKDTGPTILSSPPGGPSGSLKFPKTEQLDLGPGSTPSP